MLGYCKQCHLYKFLSENRKCDGCNSSYLRFNEDYDETNTINDFNINTTVKDLTNVSNIRE